MLLSGLLPGYSGVEDESSDIAVELEIAAQELAEVIASQGCCLFFQSPDLDRGALSPCTGSGSFYPALFGPQKRVAPCRSSGIDSFDLGSGFYGSGKEPLDGGLYRFSGNLLQRFPGYCRRCV